LTWEIAAQLLQQLMIQLVDWIPWKLQKWCKNSCPSGANEIWNPIDWPGSLNQNITIAATPVKPALCPDQGNHC
jgi:hypothetical protein